jgi:hypothetical protein
LLNYSKFECHRYTTKLDDINNIKYLQTAVITEEYLNIYKNHLYSPLYNKFIIKYNGSSYDIFLLINYMNSNDKILIIKNASYNDVFNILLKTLFN